MGSRIMVSAMLISCSLVLVNCNTGNRYTTGWGECSDPYEQALDCSFGSSLHYKDEQICWTRDPSGFRSINGANMALTSQGLDDNSTAIALSDINQTAGRCRCTDSFEQALDCGFGSSLRSMTLRLTPFLRFRRMTRNSRDYSHDLPLSSNISITEKTVFKVGVAVKSNITRFSIDVFKAAVRLLPYQITYKLIPVAGSSDILINKVAREALDVAIGDIVTTRSDHKPHVVFSLRYLEPGFMMVANPKTKDLTKFWWFLSPFTPQMWLIIAALNALIGMVIWVIESQYEDGPSFLAAIFFLQGNRIHPWQLTYLNLTSIYVSNCRPTCPKYFSSCTGYPDSLRVFLLLILTQVYTTVLTNSLQEPSSLDFNSLRQTNAVIGCDGQSQTIWHLVKVLGFNRRNIKIIASLNDCEEALYNGSIKAAFLLTPYAKILLAKHCSDLIQINPTYGNNLGGFRFVFPKGSPLSSDISDAIAALEISGLLQQMEEEMSGMFDCSRKPVEDGTIQPVGPGLFMGVFVLCGGASIIALLITLPQVLCRHLNGRIQRLLRGREFWRRLALMQTRLIA